MSQHVLKIQRSLTGERDLLYVFDAEGAIECFWPGGDPEIDLLFAGDAQQVCALCEVTRKDGKVVDIVPIETLPAGTL